MDLSEDSNGNILAQVGLKTSDLDERFTTCFYSMLHQGAGAPYVTLGGEMLGSPGRVCRVAQQRSLPDFGY